MILLLLFLILNTNLAQSKPSINVTPTTLTKSGDTVEIRWSGIQSPSELDFVGIYSPPNSTHDNYIGYLFLSKSPSWQSGSGSLSLPLINLRSNYSFRIFRWTQSEINPKRQDHDHNPLPQTRNLLGFSEEVSFNSGRGPEQIHLAFADEEDAMRVMYVTRDPKETYVKYGEREDKMEGLVVASLKRYERKHMCDAPANQSIGWRDPGYIHDALITGLDKGKKYYYKVFLSIYYYSVSMHSSCCSFSFSMGWVGWVSRDITFSFLFFHKFFYLVLLL
jgi:hypothetical protein